MTIPTIIFAFLIASLYGTLYHLVRGGGPGRLFQYLVLGWVGFALGHLVGIWQGWLLFPLGQLNLGTSTLGSLILLVGRDLFSRVGTGQQIDS
jgi:hypothetical protein